MTEDPSLSDKLTTIERKQSVRHFLIGFLLGLLFISAVTSVGCCGVAVGKMAFPTVKVEKFPVKESHVFKKENVDKAIQLFYSEWSVQYGQNKELEKTLGEIRVEFTEGIIRGIKGGFSMDGTPFPPEGVDCWGLTKAVDHVQVWIREPPYLLSKTSLVHELVHVSLRIVAGTYDADHLGDKYQGWSKTHNVLIKLMNKKLEVLKL